MLLAAGLENTEQDALRVRSSRGAIAAPHLADDQHGANRLFGASVGGFQTRTVQELGGESPLHTRQGEVLAERQGRPSRGGIWRKP